MPEGLFIPWHGLVVLSAFGIGRTQREIKLGVGRPVVLKGALELHHASGEVRGVFRLSNSKVKISIWDLGK
jgi:hypothetical protein